MGNKAKMETFLNLQNQYNQLLKVLAEENQKLNKLLPPPDLPLEELVKWYGSAKNKESLDHQFKLIKLKYEELSRIWKEYLKLEKELRII